MEQDQSFFLFCCPEEYSISFPNHSLSSNSNYFVSYTYPDGTIKKVPAEIGGVGVLLSQSPEYGHPCKVVASLHSSSEEVTEDITEFSIDLVSPMQYLFRKFSANESEMSDKVSDKMASALLAMALAYYHVMEEHVEKDKRTDEIFFTLLSCSKDKIHKKSESQKGDISEDSITKFAQQYKLRNTLQYLSGGVSVGDLAVQSPKPLCPPSDGDVPVKDAAVTSQTSSDSPPASDVHNVLNNEPPPESQPEELDQVDYEINDIPPRPPKPDTQSPSDTAQIPMKKPTINPPIKSNTLPTSNNAYDVPNNKPLPGAPPEELDQVDYEITEPPLRPPKPDATSACNGEVTVQKSAVDSQAKSDSQPNSKNIYNVPNNKPLPGRPPIELDQEEYVITDPPPRPPKPDVVSPNGKATQAKSDSSGNAYNVPSNKPLLGSPLMPTDQEGYVEMDLPPVIPKEQCLDDGNDVEECVLTDQTDGPQVRYVEGPSKSTKSLSNIQPSGQSPTTFKPPATLPRVRSATVTGQLIIGEEYEIWEATPAEMAAEKAMKKRGPQPKLPVPYQKSRSLDRKAKYSVSSSGRESTSSDVDSSPASPLQNASSPVELKPPPRRKFSIHKPRANKQPT